MNHGKLKEHDSYLLTFSILLYIISEYKHTHEVRNNNNQKNMWPGYRNSQTVHPFRQLKPTPSTVYFMVCLSHQPNQRQVTSLRVAVKNLKCPSWGSNPGPPLGKSTTGPPRDLYMGRLLDRLLCKTVNISIVAL